MKYTKLYYYKPKTVKLKNFNRIKKKLLFKNQLSQTRSVLTANSLYSDWIELETFLFASAS